MAINEPSSGWGRKQMNGVIQAVIRAVGVALGLFLIVIAIPFAVTPIPLGLPLLILGLLILAGTSKTAHTLITNFLKRHPGLWNRVKHIFDRFHKDEDKGGQG
ncbi:MAG: hypothetical protein NXI12_04330 [Alphaproteobacteria bacterium]|nr:hypothetical protein [Alphaproteobacteria bacterium]